MSHKGQGQRRVRVHTKSKTIFFVEGGGGKVKVKGERGSSQGQRWVRVKLFGGNGRYLGWKLKTHCRPCDFLHEHFYEAFPNMSM